MQDCPRVWKSGGGACSNVVDITCPLVEIGVTDLPKIGGRGKCPPCSLRFLRHCMVVAQPPVSVAGGGDLPMRKKIDILENCCSRPIVKKKNSYIVIPTFSWACLSWRLSQQNRWWPRVIAVRAQQKGVGGFGREEGGQNGVKSISDGAFLFLLNDVFTRFIAV